ncbi:hypothetical protein HY501_02710 [Candidatus Woesearchaeota archaeon]|nr:hypothetical protein [Candidatus Woesearchaeota archaeon]
MKKEALIFLIALSIVVSGCSTPLPNEMQAEEPIIAEQSEPIATIPIEPELPEEIPNLTESAEGEIMEGEEIKLFDPTLTYPGAYNGPLYATSEQIGNFPDKEMYISNLKRNGVNFFIGMFAILGKTTPETFASNANLGYVADLVLKYPGMAVPFFGSGFGGEQLDPLVRSKGDIWVGMYKDVLDTYAPFVGEDFIKGFGEVETQEWSVGHNHPNILKLIDLANREKKHVMFHPVADKLGDVKEMVEMYPDTTFLIHLYREDAREGKQEWIDMMKTHDNLYLSIDAAHIIHHDDNDILYSYHDEYGKNANTRFIFTVNENYDSILSSAVAEYKQFVEEVPDKVMWGTEAGPRYSFEPDVYDLLIKVSRDFIAKVTDDPAKQEALAYKNALRVFGPGVTLKQEVSVIDASSWPPCKLPDIDENCGDCGLSEDDEEADPEAEACENDCIQKMQCIDPIEES